METEGHYRVHSSPPMDHVLSQLNLIHTRIPYFFNNKSTYYNFYFSCNSNLTPYSNVFLLKLIVNDRLERTGLF
jgi:hypothetical protein